MILRLSLAAALVTAGLAAPALAAPFAWNAATGNWSTPGNWTPAGPPGPTDNVTIGVAAAITMDVDATVDNVSMASGSTVTISGAGRTLTLNPAAGTGISHTGSGAFTISAGVALARSQSFSVGSTGNLTISGAVSGAFDLTKTGAGTGSLILGGSNSYNATTVSAGTLQVITASSFGASGQAITLAGGTLSLRNNSAMDFTAGGTRTYAVTVTGNATIDVRNNGSGTDARHTISSLTVNTGVTLTRTGADTYQLGTTTLTVSGTGLISRIAASSGMFVTGSSSDGGGSGGTWLLRGSPSTPASTDYNQGLHFTSSNTLTATIDGRSTSLSSTILGASGATLTYNGVGTFYEAGFASGRLVLIARNSGTVIIGASAVINHRNITTGMSQTLQMRGDSTGVVSFATGFNANSAGAGIQGLRIFNGVVFETNDSLNLPNVVIFAASESSTWRVATAAQTRTATATSTILVDGTGTIQTNTDLTLGATLSGAGPVIKTGTGVLTLSHAGNLHTGGIALNAGTLKVNGGFTGTDLITVASGATLTGTGAASTVTATNGARIAPGDGAVGTLTTGALTLTDTTQLDLELGAPGTSDRIAVSAANALTLDGVINITSTGGLAAGSYTIMTYGGALTDNTVKFGTAPSGFGYTVAASGGAVTLTVAVVTAVEELVAEALRHGPQVTLRWRTGVEVDNLGFNVYREARGQRLLLTPSPVAGSALLAGAGVRLSGGRVYSWADRPPAEPVRYWIEALDLSGARALHGPFTPAATATPPDEVQAVTLALLGVDRETPTRASGREPTSSRRGRDSWPAAAGPAVKITVREDGLHRITQPELLAAGLAPGTDPRTLRVTSQGQELAVRVDGEDDGRLDPQDSLELYATGLDSVFSDARVYWLTSGPGRGARHRQRPPAGGSAGSGAWPFALVDQPRTIYFAALKNGERNNFFGPVLHGQPVSRLLSVVGLEPGPATLQVTVQGATDVAHVIAVTVNGAAVGTLTIAGRLSGTQTFTLPSSVLREGDNQVILTPRGGGQDTSVLDTIRLVYPRTHRTAASARWLEVAGGRTVRLGGFTSAGARVFDVTDDRNVEELHVRSVPGATGTDLTDLITGTPSHGRRTLLTVAPGQTMTALVQANRPSDWSRFPGADLVMVGRRDLLETMAPLRALRQSQGWSVALVDIEDVYDEQSYGEKTPWALRDFLVDTAARWSRPARAVLLVGDATFDPRDYLGKGSFDVVPTKLVDTEVLETASDDWLVTPDKGGAAALTVGRFPVRTADQAARLVAKTLAHERALLEQSQVVLVADRGPGADFEAMSASLATLLPAAAQALHISRGVMGGSAARVRLLQALNEGPLAVNYLGHGSEAIWAGHVLTSDDAANLVNADRPTLFVAMTCLNGMFQDVHQTPLAKAMLLAEHGGAFAAWASSGLTEPGPQHVMNQELWRGLFAGGLTLGEAARTAKAAITDRDVRSTWILLGDPTARMHPQPGASVTTSVPAPPLAAVGQALLSQARPGWSCALSPGAGGHGAPLLVLVLVIGCWRRRARSRRLAHRARTTARPL